MFGGSLDPVFGRLPPIREAEANRLLTTGEWLSDAEAKRLLADRACQLDVARLPMAPGSDQLDHMRACLTAFLYALSDHYEARQVLDEAARPADPRQLRQELRIRPHVIFRASAAATDAVLAVATIAATVAAGPIGYWTVIGVGVPAVDLIRKAASHVVRLTDPTERLVFEKIWELSARYNVVDHDALNEGCYERAYRPLLPTDEEVLVALAGENPADVRRALADLIDKSVVERTGSGQLKVVF